MGARSRMDMRLYAERNAATKDVLGHQGPPNWIGLGTFPARVWVVTGDTRHAEGLSVDASRYRAMVPLGTDITSVDRAVKVTNRRAVDLFGTLYIDAVLPRPDHLELRMRDHE